MQTPSKCYGSDALHLHSKVKSMPCAYNSIRIRLSLEINISAQNILSIRIRQKLKASLKQYIHIVLPPEYIRQLNFDLWVFTNVGNICIKETSKARVCQRLCQEFVGYFY